LHLLKYGFDKVLKLQFYLPEPNTLYTPLGQLPPDLAYWSVMGASRFYTVFAGVMEVLPGLLLLWGRTRRLGGVWALAVLINVLALNIGFNISVKLWAGFLVGLATVVAGPLLMTGWRALLEWPPTQSGPARPATWRGRWVGAARGLGLGLLLAEALEPVILHHNFDDDQAARPFLHGAYLVVPNKRSSALETDATRLLRVFVHRRGYFVTQTVDGRLRDYPLTYAPDVLVLSLQDTLRYMRVGPDLLLVGTLDGQPVRLRCRPLAYRMLPLLQ
jgi:hypothetical protein